LAAAQAESKKTGMKKRYIYISGSLVYGDHPGELLDETFSCTAGPMLQWRIAFEKHILNQNEVHGVIVRPSPVYGDDWGLWRWLWQPTDKMMITGHHDRMITWNHCSDVADALLRIVEAPTSLVSGEIFDIAEDTRILYYDLRRAIFKVAGYNVKEEAAQVDDKSFIDVISNVRCLPTAQKLRKVLGWKPRHCILDCLEISFKNLNAHGLIRRI